MAWSLRKERKLADALRSARESAHLVDVMARKLADSQKEVNRWIGETVMLRARMHQQERRGK